MYLSRLVMHCHLARHRFYHSHLICLNVECVKLSLHTCILESDCRQGKATMVWICRNKWYWYWYWYWITMLL